MLAQVRPLAKSGTLKSAICAPAMPTSTALDAVALTGRGRIQTPRARGFFETAKGGTFGSTAPVDDDAVGE